MKIIIDDFEFTKEQAEKVYLELKEVFGAKEDLPVHPFPVSPYTPAPYTPYTPDVYPYPDWFVRPGTISSPTVTSNEYWIINKEDIPQ